MPALVTALATIGYQAATVRSFLDALRAGGQLLCYEADPAHWHRSMVADALEALVPVQVTHLQPTDE